MPRGLLARAALVVACAAACQPSPVAQRGRGASPAATGGASSVATGGARAASPATAVLLARLESREVTESSGIVASRRNPGLFWTHNDSGDGPFVYAFDRAGRARGVWRVE